MTLPAGFELEPQKGGLPPGFELEGQPTLADYGKRYLKDTAKGFFFGEGPLPPGPAGAAAGASKLANELLEKGAYRAGQFVTDQATGMGASPEVAAGAGYAANVGTQAVPALAGGAGASRVLSGPMQSAARELMARALRAPLAAQRTGKEATAVETLLTEGHNPTLGGARDMWNKVSNIGDEVKARIANSTAATTVDDILREARASALRRFEDKPNALQAGEQISAAAENFAGHPTLQRAERYAANEIPMQEAQRLKQGYQAGVGDKGYGELKTPETEMEKAIAAQLRIAISRGVPEVSALNAREAGLITAAKLAERRGYMSGKNNPVSLGTSFAAIQGEPAAALGMYANSSDMVKSLLARGLYSGSERIPQAAASLGIARMGKEGATEAPPAYPNIPGMPVSPDDPDQWARAAIARALMNAR